MLRWGEGVFSWTLCIYPIICQQFDAVGWRQKGRPPYKNCAEAVFNYSPLGDYMKTLPYLEYVYVS